MYCISKQKIGNCAKSPREHRPQHAVRANGTVAGIFLGDECYLVASGGKVVNIVAADETT